MKRRSRCLLLIGCSLVLGSAGAALAADTAGPDGAPPGRLELAQAHEHGEQGGAEHAPSTPAPPPSAEHGQAPHQPDQAAPDQQHMMMPQAPMHEMPSMMGMDHGSEAAGTGGHDMSPVDVSEAPAAGPEARGGQLLEPTLRDGIKEFELSTGVVRWNLLPDLEVGAYAYNGQVPGPLIRVEPNDRVRVLVKNELPEATTVHWHGLILPIEQDGVPELSQPPIPPGGEHVYEFEVPDTPGTYFYHTHFGADRQQPLGLYGALIIDDPAGPADVAHEQVITLGEWTVLGNETYPAMQLDGMLPNYFTFNGKSYPATETVEAKVGDRILFRLIGSGQFIHPIHIHGGPFEIVATDGNPVPEGARLTKDTVLVGPGERYDVVWTARSPGKWLLHCHINHHVTNDGAEIDGGGGMTMIIDIAA
jgi:FtsP/CotA-like multicopper oxidase with cupredoxin domain